MKPTNATLNALLASRQFYAVDLYQITLSTGDVLRYCQGQTDIIYLGNTYSAGGQTGPYFDRKDNKAKVSWKLGAGNDSLVIDVIPGIATTINGISWLASARAGIFDGADFQLSRAFMSTYGSFGSGSGTPGQLVGGTGTPINLLVGGPSGGGGGVGGGVVLMFQGRIAEVDADRSILTFTINDYRELLSQQLPRNLFSPNCQNTLGDASCTVNLNSFSANGTVGAGSTVNTIVASLPNGDGYYDNGKIKFTSGILNNLTYGISQFAGGNQLAMVAPLPFLPSVGDTFTAFAGCDRTLGSGGCAKFSNTPNFRGFPYVPDPQLAL